MLQPADVRVLRRQLDRLGAVQHGSDRLLGLPQGGLAWVDLEREDRREARLHLGDRVRLQDVDRQGPVLGLAEHRRLLLVLVAERHDDVRLVDVAGDLDGQLKVADRLLQPLPTDALGQDLERRQRGAARHEDRLAVLAFLDPDRCVDERIVLVVEIVGVHRASPFVGPEGRQRAGGLIAPRLLAIELARLAGARVGHRRSAPFERSTIGDRPGHEGRIVEVRPVAAARRHGETFTGDDAGRSTLRIAAPRRRLASRAAAGLAPAAARSGPIAGTEPRPSPVELAIAAGAVGPLAPPAGLHPPRLARPDEAGKALRADLLARRRSRPCLAAVHALLVPPAELRGDRVAAEQ